VVKCSDEFENGCTAFRCTAARGWRFNVSYVLVGLVEVTELRARGFNAHHAMGSSTMCSVSYSQGKGNE